MHTHRSTTQAALRQLEGVEVHGQKVMVRDDTQLVASRGGTRVFAGNLSAAHPADVRRLLRQHLQVDGAECAAAKQRGADVRVLVAAVRRV